MKKLRLSFSPHVGEDAINISNEIRLPLAERVRGWNKVQRFAEFYLPCHAKPTAELMEKNRDKTWQDVEKSTMPLKN